MENQPENQPGFRENSIPKPSPVTVNVATEEKTKSSKGCIWWTLGTICFLFFMCGAIFLVAVFVTMLSSGSGGGSFASFSPSYPEIQEEFISGDFFAQDKVAVIDIRGIIVDAQASWGGGDVANATLISNMISKAKSDPTVKAVVLRLDTPGGEVTASDVIYHKIMQLRKDTGKPVVSSMGSVAASGGVYVAVASDYIIANKLTTTGSIGVIAQAYNYTELFKKIGLKAEVYKSGKMKDLLNGARPRTQEEVEIIDEFIGEVYDEFVSIVAERRNLDLAKIKNSPMCDGRFYSGKQALKYGLIDETGYFEDAVDKAVKMANLKEYKVVQYKQMFGLASILFGASARPTEVKVELPGAANHIELPNSGKFFLLPPAW